MRPAGLPPGPSYPSAIQSHRVLDAPLRLPAPVPRALRQALHDRLPLSPPFVMLTDPAEVKEVFTAPPDVLRPGEGARVLEPIVGSNSVLLLDESAHMEPAQAAAAGLPRRAHGAPERPDGGGDSRGAGPLAARRADRTAPAHAGPDPEDHPPRRLWPRPWRALRDPPRAAAGDARVRRQADQPDAAAERQPRGANPRKRRAVRALHPYAGKRSTRCSSS